MNPKRRGFNRYDPRIELETSDSILRRLIDSADGGTLAVIFPQYPRFDIRNADRATVFCIAPGGRKSRANSKLQFGGDSDGGSTDDFSPSARCSSHNQCEETSKIPRFVETAVRPFGRSMINGDFGPLGSSENFAAAADATMVQSAWKMVVRRRAVCRATDDFGIRRAAVLS